MFIVAHEIVSAVNKKVRKNKVDLDQEDGKLLSTCVSHKDSTFEVTSWHLIANRPKSINA